MKLNLAARILGLIAVIQIGFMAVVCAAPERVVIWKFDDVKAGEAKRIAPGFKRVVEWAKEHQTFVTLGVICDSLEKPSKEDVEWIRANAVENGGRVEFWLHGWDHSSSKNAEGVPVWEFKGVDVATQAKHFRDSCDIFKKVTGVTFQTFGAPFNAIDANTPLAMESCPELRIWMYGPKGDSKRTVIDRTLNLEVATGKVSYTKFMEAYQAKPLVGPLLLQGHSGMWNDESYADFVKIAEVLEKDGWVTKTAVQYVDSWPKSTK